MPSHNQAASHAHPPHVQLIQMAIGGWLPKRCMLPPSWSWPIN